MKNLKELEKKVMSIDKMKAIKGGQSSGPGYKEPSVVGQIAWRIRCHFAGPCA